MPEPEQRALQPFALQLPVERQYLEGQHLEHCLEPRQGVMVGGGQTFVISLLTAIVVSVAVHLAFRQLEQAQPVPEVVQEEQPETVTVPNLSGLTVDVAQARLAQVELELGPVTKEASHDVPKGQVIDTVPPRFAQIRAGLAVGLRVSAGVAEVEVPNVRRLNQKKAIAKLEEAGFKVEVKKIYNEDLMFNRVINQAPKAGEKLEKGGTVTITLNSEDEYY